MTPACTIIYRHIFFKAAALLAALIVLIILPGCTDDTELPGGKVESGLPTTVTLSVNAAEITSISRGDLAEGLDKIVSSLYIAAYDVNSGKRTGMFTLHDDHGVEFHELNNITIEAMSGECYIVGVANYEFRPGYIYGYDESGGNLEAALLAADTWDKYSNIFIGFDSMGDISIEAPTDPLMMSGFYTEDDHQGSGSRPNPQPVTLQPGSTTLRGAVHLRRLISQVKFNVTYNKENIKSFKINSWRVVNLPVSSWLHERTDAAENRNSTDIAEINGHRFDDTSEMIELGIDDATSTFDFWMIENRRNGKAPDGSTVDYSWREREHKDADGGNTGKYRLLIDADEEADNPANMATYVELNVAMEMAVDEEGENLNGTTRKVDATYIVHLGYCEGADDHAKTLDYNCRRNAKYTYNVIVNNIADIYVEAHNDNDEPSPGAEGMVTDITNEFYQLDAHYAVVPVEFTENDLATFKFYIEAYDLNGNRVIIDSTDPKSIPTEGEDTFRYLSWVEFRRSSTQNGSYLEQYKPRTGQNSDSKTYLLTDINSNREEGWYTMFINEYVYENDGNESATNNWQGYVNRPDRRVWLNVAIERSKDGASIHHRSKYSISQQSIQTFYQHGATNSGIGVEHTNESLGLNLRNNYRYEYNFGNPNSGRYNLAEYLYSPSSVPYSWDWSDNTSLWDTFLSLNEFQTVNAINNQDVVRDAHTEYLPKIEENRNDNDKGTSYNLQSYDPDTSDNPQYIEAIRACLNRNRDLDGDGKIDADELRWFVPTYAEYVSIILGRSSLTSPLVELGSVTKLKDSNNLKNNSLLFYTSEGKMLWAMEGISSSKWRGNASGPTPWMVRCIRKLGSNLKSIDNSSSTEPSFRRIEGTNVIDLSRYDSRSLRTEAYHTSSHPMPVHHIYDYRYNRCYKKFEFSDKVIYLNDPELGIEGTTITWDKYLADNNPCSILTETTGKNGWRVPNQKELAIMCLLDVMKLNGASTGSLYLSCSYSYFDKEGYSPGNNPDNQSGTIGSEYHRIMKARGSDWVLTQGDSNILNENISGNKWGIRCVRDYTE